MHIPLCRELTKLHEEVIRTNLDGAVERCASQGAKGEYVLVLEGCAPVEEAAPTLEDGLARVEALREEGCSLKDAVKQVAKAMGLGRNELYAAAVNGEGSQFRGIK